MNLRWNPDGKGIRAVPPHLEAFARAKRKEFLINCALSAACGLALGRTFAVIAGVPHALEGATIVGVGCFLAVSTLVLGVGFSSLF